MRKFLAVILLLVMAGGIATLFWYDDWRYKLPTPVPEAHVEVEAGSPVDLAGVFAQDHGRPVFIHFFNPKCPCSRFNVPHFRALAKAYGDQVDFNVVVVSDDAYAEADIRDRLGVDVPVSFDTTLAAACGVYATPQAVLIGADNKLFYRGNYNKTRYCTDKATEFARMALDSLLNERSELQLGEAAITSYGCALPKTKR